MKELSKKLKLNQFSKVELERRTMNALTGGGNDPCSCILGLGAVKYIRDEIGTGSGPSDETIH